MQIIKVHHDQWSYHFFKVSDWSPHICDSVHTQRTELCCFPVIKPTWHNQNKESTDKEESRKETKTKTKAGSAMWREHQQSCRRNSCYGNAGTAIGSWRLQVQIQRNFSKGQLINISEETGCDENDNVPGQVMLTKKKKPSYYPWLVWLRGSSAVHKPKGPRFESQISAHAWVANQVPSRGCARSNHTLIFLFLFFPPFPPLSKNK